MFLKPMTSRTAMKVPRAVCCLPYSAPTPAQVKEAMAWEVDHATLLSNAAKSGSKDTFEAVVAALEDKLTPAEVMVEGMKILVFPHLLNIVVARWGTR